MAKYLYLVADCKNTKCANLCIFRYQDGKTAPPPENRFATSAVYATRLTTTNSKICGNNPSLLHRRQIGKTAGKLPLPLPLLLR
jgi:hypothetical protein